MTDNSSYILSCNNLCKNYKVRKEKVSVINGINFHVKYGQLVAILGKSGSGKSTLLNLIGGLDQPDSGSVYISGENLNNLSVNKRAKLRNRKIGFIYQFHHLLSEFNALENVMMPLMMRRKSNIKDNEEKAIGLLRSVGLENRLSHKPSQLSGGERQRVAIARALVTNPACILADEPTGNLDNYNASLIFELIRQLSIDYNISFVVVTHNTSFANKMDHCYTLEKGVILKNK